MTDSVELGSFVSAMGGVCGSGEIVQTRVSLKLVLSLLMLLQVVALADPDLTATDPYKILGISRSANEDQALAGYRAARKWIQENVSGEARIAAVETITKAFEEVGDNFANGVRDRFAQEAEIREQSAERQRREAREANERSVRNLAADLTAQLHSIASKQRKFLQEEASRGQRVTAAERRNFAFINVLREKVGVAREENHRVNFDTTVHPALMAAVASFVEDRFNSIEKDKNWFKASEIGELLSIIHTVANQGETKEVPQWKELKKVNDKLVQIGKARAKTSEDRARIAYYEITAGNPSQYELLSRFEKSLEEFKKANAFGGTKAFLVELAKATRSEALTSEHQDAEARKHHGIELLGRIVDQARQEIEGRKEPKLIKDVRRALADSETWQVSDRATSLAAAMGSDAVNPNGFRNRCWIAFSKAATYIPGLPRAK